MAPRAYSDFEGDPCTEDEIGGIVGQVSGPKSWSEYEDDAGPVCRRNVTQAPGNIPSTGR
jgi:hypothetical protein